jgi:hypothetical protein
MILDDTRRSDKTFFRNWGFTEGTFSIDLRQA